MSRTRLPAEMLWSASYLSERVSWLRATPHAPAAVHERPPLERDRSPERERIRRDWLRWARRLGVQRGERIAAARTAPPGDRPPFPAKEWETCLVQALARIGAGAARDSRGGSDHLDVLVEPFVAVAIRRLTRRIAALQAQKSDLVADGFLDGVATALRRMLLGYASKTLILEVNVARMRGELPGDTPEERFRAFVQRLRSSPRRLRALYLRYPVLARLLATQTVHVAALIERILSAYAADAVTLRDLTSGNEPGPVSAIGFTGDPHDGGQRVSIVTFARGARVVFKPRSLARDVAFQEFLGWVNGHGLRHGLPQMRVIPRNGYGWVEYLHPREVDERAGIGRYYYRLGAFLSLLWAIRGCDIHFENLIAVGEDPYLVDLEVLFDNEHRRPTPRPRDGLDVPSMRALQNSVLEVGMLPSGGAGGDDPPPDLSALGKKGEPVWSRKAEVIVAGLTDEIRIGAGVVTIGSSPNLPRHAGEEVSVLGFEDDFVGGFRDACTVVATNAATLVRLDGPLGALVRSESRAVLTPTYLYAHVFNPANHPDQLRDGLWREALIASALQTIATGTRKPQKRRLLAAEFAAMAAGDIPKFTAAPRSHDVWADTTRVRYFRTAAWTAVRRRLATLDTDECARQEAIIQHSLAMLRFNGGDPHVAPRRMRQDGDDGGAVTEWSRTAALAEAADIGRRLCAMAISAGGVADWYSVAADPKDAKFVYLAPAGASLYAGAAGPALFLAQLSRLVPDAVDDAVLRSSVEFCRRALEISTADEGAMPHGAFSGRTSVGYALLLIGSALERGDLVSEALDAVLAAARNVLAVTANGDVPKLDVMEGRAGLLMVLLAFAEATGASAALESAARLGDHLIDCRIERGNGVAWPSAIETTAPMTGVAHGAGGIAWALLRLAAATSDRRPSQIARQALRYERSRFNPERFTWPEVRVNAVGNLSGESGMSWCYGAPGAGIARLAVPDVSRDDEDTREAIALAEFGGSAAAAANDCLCHGELGNLELLTVGALRLGRADWLEMARHRGAAALRRRSLAEDWRGGLTATYQLPTPGLMLGLAGIGYQLLRLAEPRRVASLLALASPQPIAQPAESRCAVAGA